MSITGHIRRAFWLAFFVGGLLAGQVIVAGEPGEYTFCSYNLKNWLKMERFQGDAEALADKPEDEKQRVIVILKKISPDVLGVCEIGTEEDVEDLRRHLKKAGMDFPHVEHAHGGDPTRRLALLSRFPIVGRDSQTSLSYKIGAQTLPIQRGILDATVRFPEGLAVRFVGVHLKSMREVENGDQAQMRRNEARLLRLHLDGIFSQDSRTRVLCYGDFNEHRNEPAIDEIMGSKAADSYMADLPLKDVNGQVWTHFWDTADSYARLDYVFCSRMLRPHVLLRMSRVHHERDFDKASDHRPLVVTIKGRL